MKQRILLNYQAGLGDIVLATAIARDIHAAYPEKFELFALTSFPAVWMNNPHCKGVKSNQPGASIIDLKRSFRSILSNMRNQRKKIHCLQGKRDAFTILSRIPVPLTKPHGDLHLTDIEKRPIISGKYWVIVGGGKLDITVKHWQYEKWQAVVDGLAARGIKTVQVGAYAANHWHPTLRNAFSAVGYTEESPTRNAERDLFSIIHGAEGVICGITGVMHIAAALQKPCVVLGSASEEPWWEHYSDEYGAMGAKEPVAVPHDYLTHFGKLHCCADLGCWRKLTIPLNNADVVERKDKLCLEPVRMEGQAVAACMMSISPEDVIEKVMSHNPTPWLEPLKWLQELPFKQPTTKNLAGVTEFHPPVKVEGVASRCVWDHPILGGKVTVCVLCYGDYPQLARTCLGSLFNSQNSDRFEIRVFANECGIETIAYLKSLPLRKLIISPTNICKAAACRQLWHDSEDPIATPYIVWLDDDSFAVDYNWPTLLANTIIANHQQGARLYGIRFIHDLRIYQHGSHNPNAWFKEAPWYQNRPWCTSGGTQATSNGTVIPFVSGGFLAIASQVVKDSNIPDLRLNHNGIDVTIGAQVYQAGYAVKDFNRDKKFIHSSGHRRRGWGEPFQWASPASQDKFYRDNVAAFQKQYGVEPKRWGRLIQMP
jgi:ADP-heptose:LPS heptosyltransferase